MERTDHDILIILERDIHAMKKSISSVEEDMEDLKNRMEEKYTLKIEFTPIQRIVYGMVSLSLIAIATALLALLFK